MTAAQKKSICGVALHPCPVKCSLREAEEANVRVSGSELPISENSLFNGVNHCGVQVSTPHSVGFARLASELFTVPSDFRLFTASSSLKELRKFFVIYIVLRLHRS